MSLFFIIPSVTFSRDVLKADSLIQLLKNDISKIERAELLLSISRIVKIDTAMTYANQALLLAEELENDILKARIYEEQSLIQRKLGNTVQAFEHSFLALDIYENSKKEKRVALLNEQIGSHYLYEKNFDKAIYHYRIALEKNEDSTDVALIAINLGEAFRISERLDSAAFYFKLALDIRDVGNKELIHAYAIGNLGLVHSAQGITEIALSELETALDVLTNLGDHYAASYYKSEIGKIYTNIGRETEGEQLLLESLATANEIGLKEQIKDISKILAEFYERKQVYAKALAYRKQYEVYADSLQNLDNVRKIEGLRADQAIEQKQKEVEYLDQINESTKRLNTVFGLGLFGVSILSFLLFSSYRKIQKTNRDLEIQKKVVEKREVEKGLLLRELNHRVKNNLQMVASLLNLQSNQIVDEEASKALASGKMRVEALSLIHQKLYSKDHHTTIKIKEYLEELVQNLAYTFNPEVQAEIRIEDVDMDIDKAIPLGLIINELCTNALKYAFVDHNDPTLTVQLEKHEKELNLLVKDNGQGFINKENNQQSFGLRLVHSLIDQMDASITQENNSGCQWNIMIPR